MTDVLNDEILYVGEHITCNQYMHDITYGFSYREIERGDTEKVDKLSKNVILLITDGECSIQCDGSSFINVYKEQILFLPKGSRVSYKVLSRVKVIILTFETLLSGCDVNMLDSCARNVEKIVHSFKPLKMREPIQHYCFTLKYCLQRKVNCSHFHELMHKELFMYLRYFYTKEELANFFYPILCTKDDFKQFILRNWEVGMSIDDIIDMMPMSKSTFIRIFSEQFNMTPYSWYQKLVRDKMVAKAIYPDTTLKDLMKVAHISDASQFNRFCKRNFDCTPKKFLERYGKLK